MKKTTQERKEDEDNDDMTRVKKAVSASSAMAAAWAQLYQGRDLHELSLDPFTCSEILRLHFLSSGASLGEYTIQDVFFFLSWKPSFRTPLTQQPTLNCCLSLNIQFFILA